MRTYVGRTMLLAPLTRLIHLGLAVALVVGLAWSALGAPIPAQAAGAPSFTSAAPPAGTYASLYTHAFKTTDPLALFAVSAGALPTGLVLAPVTGLLTGVPLQTGSFPITVRATNAFGSATQSVTLVINKVPLTITAQNTTSVYGSVLPGLTFSTSGLVNGDLLSSVLSGQLSTTATAGSPVGSYPITQGTLNALNYAISFVPGTVNIMPAPLTVTAAAQARKVGEANPALTFSVNGLVNGDTLAALTTPPTLSTNAAINSPAGSYAITLNGGIAANYLLTLVNSVLNVTNKDVPLINWSAPAPIIYGTPLGTTQLNAAATLNGLPVLGSFSYDPPLGTVLQAGTQSLRVTFTPSDLVAFAQVSATVPIQVNRAPLTLTAQNRTSVYGAPLPALSVAANGLVNGDVLLSALQGQLTTNATAGSHVGSYSITQGTLGAVNYAISFVPSTLAITPAPLTITADNLVRTQGEPNPTLSFSVSGLVNGDTLANALTSQLTVNTSATANSPVGSYPITLSGAGVADYLLTLVNGVLTIVNKAVPQIDWAAPAPITYGTPLGAAQLSAAATLNGLSVLGSFSYDPPLGTVLQAGGNQTLRVTFTPTDLAAFVQVSATVPIQVNRAPLAVSANAASKIYGGPLPDLTYSASGLVNGNTLASVLSGQPSTTATASSPVGSYSITQGTLGALNYLVNFTPSTLAITPAPLAITADAKTRTVGEANPALTFSVSGLVNGDTLGTIFSGQPTLSTSATISSPAGSYPITVNGGNVVNYLLTLVNSVLTITDKDVPQINWPTPVPITYGTPLGAAHLNAIAALNGLPVAGSFSYDPPLGTVLQAGTQTLRVVFTPSDLATFVQVSLSVPLQVNRAPLAVSANAASKVYGAALPALTYTASGLVNNDLLNNTLQGEPSTNATVNSHVGTYLLTQGTLNALNYLINFTPSTFTVTPAPLTVTADAKIRKTGEPNPALTTSMSGLVNGDTVASALTNLPTISTAATLNSPAGSYPITLNGGNALDYLLTLVNGTLTITNKDLPLITWNAPAAITYGMPLGAAQLNAAATLNNQPVAGSFSYVPPLGTALQAGSNQNLRVVFMPSDLAAIAPVEARTLITVNRAPLAITAESINIAAGDALPTLAVRYDGLVNGDTVASLDAGVVVRTTATTTNFAGSYPISADNASDNNYAVNFVDGTLTIATKLNVVGADRGAPGSSFDFQARGFQPNQMLDIAIDGRKALEVLASSSGKTPFSLYFGPASPARTYTVTATPRGDTDDAANTTVTIDPSAPRIGGEVTSVYTGNNALPTIYVPLIQR